MIAEFRQTFLLPSGSVFDERMTGPDDEYATRRNARSASLADAKRRDLWLANVRLAVFAAGLVLLWAVFGSPRWPFAVLSLPMVMFAGLMIAHERNMRVITHLTIAVDFYERGIARLEDRWAGTGVRGEEYRPRNHVYAEDLDLFGPASLFELLCTARTRAGERALAGWLCAPATADEISVRHEAVRELRAMLDAREALAVAGGAARAVRPIGFVEEWATMPSGMPGGAWPWIFRALSALPFVMASVGWQLGGAGWGFLILGALPGLAMQRRYRERVQQALTVNDGALRELHEFSGVSRCIETGTFSSTMPKRLQAELTTDGRTASKAIALLARLVEWKEARNNGLFAPLAVALLWDIHFGYALEWWRRRYGSRVAAWYRAVGEFEALCALAAYAYENPDDVFPDFVDETARFEGNALGHPLLPRRSCVRNSVRLDGTPRVLIVSGSNMSGKSTLLRTVGANAVLAMAGAPVRAKALRMSPVQVGASMHIVDSIQQGTSHFYAEIQRLKAIQDLTRDPRPVLFLVDEILHGTNSHDRSIGAEAVLRQLTQAGAIGLITTHDLALTAIAERLGAQAENVHFEDHLENGRLKFDYTMRQGVVQRSNAVALMRQIGLDV